MDFLTNQRIRLRALEPEDLPNLYLWENDTTQWTVGNTRTPLSHYQLKQYIAQSSFDILQNGLLKLMIEDKKERKAVGILDLFDLDIHHSRVAIGIFIAPENQQKGYAKQSLQIAEKYLFNLLHIHQIYAHIAETNQKSQQLFSKNGYQHTSTLHQWLKTTNGYEDIRCYQKINPHDSKTTTTIDSYQ